LLAGGCSGGGEASQDAAATDAAIRAVMQAQADAWNANDIEGFMEGYWRSPEMIFGGSGAFTRGWQPTLDRYKVRYPSGGMGTLTFSELEIHPIEAGHAWVIGKWALEMADASPSGAFSLIFAKKPEGWKIIHDHSSSVADE